MSGIQLENLLKTGIVGGRLAQLRRWEGALFESGRAAAWGLGPEHLRRQPVKPSRVIRGPMKIVY